MKANEWIRTSIIVTRSWLINALDEYVDDCAECIIIIIIIIIIRNPLGLCNDVFSNCR